MISRRTPSQQAATLFPCLTIQHNLPDAGEMQITALYHEAALPGEQHICCQPVIFKLLLAKRPPPVTCCASSGMLSGTGTTSRPS